MQQPKTRSGYKKHEPYPLNRPSDQTIEGIGKRIVHLLAVGRADMTGDEWSRIFADAITGDNFGNPLGVADVAWNGCAWSVKTVKVRDPFNVGRKLRLISGRNSPYYSAGISDPMADIQATGRAVLEVYNHRIDEAREQHDDVRLIVLARNISILEFALYERPLVPVVVGNYVWQTNRRGNLEAINEAGEHAYTWQPHGSQFTIIERLPRSATLFRIKKHPGMLEMSVILQAVRFKPDWIEVIAKESD